MPLSSLCLELYIFEVMAYGDINLFFSLCVSGELLFPVGSAAGQGGRGGCHLLVRMVRKESEA